MTGSRVTFETLFMHCTHELVRPEASLQTLVDSLVRRASDAAAVKRGVRLVLHRLSSPALSDETVHDWLLVLAHIIAALRKLGNTDVRDVAAFCVGFETTKSLCSRSLSTALREGSCMVLTLSAISDSLVGFDQLLGAVSEVGGEDVAHFFAEMTARWVSVLRESLDNISEDQVSVISRSVKTRI